MGCCGGTDSIPSPVQWIKVILCCCNCGLDSNSGPGTSIRCGCNLKKKKNFNFYSRLKIQMSDFSLKWNQAGSYRAPGHKSLSVSPILFLGNGPHSASMAFPEFQGTGSDSCLSGKKGDAKTMEEESSNKRTALGQNPGSVSRDIHIYI